MDDPGDGFVAILACQLKNLRRQKMRGRNGRILSWGALSDFPDSDTSASGVPAHIVLYRRVFGPVQVMRSASASKLKAIRRAKMHSREALLWFILLLLFLSMLRTDGTIGMPFGRGGIFGRDPLAPGEPPHRRAYLAPIDVMDHSPDECADALQIPKVALLFLTKGMLYHEPSWRLWLKSAEGLVPSQIVADHLCDIGVTGVSASSRALMAESKCRIDHSNRGDVEYRKQYLFSMYVHAPPTFKGYHKDSLWFGKLVEYRVATEWGAHTLVEATRHLLWQAYRDPLNSRFLLLSESDIPLYDPLTLYQQLQTESNSRLDTCPHEGTSPWRWHPRMETRNLKFHHWRKSPQWMTMTRAHAKLALEDSEVYRMFERHCWSAWDSQHSRWHRDCFSDEHYFATLLASKGKDNEGVCQSRGVSFTQWEINSAHPKSFRTSDINQNLIREARQAPKSVAGENTPPCDWKNAEKEAHSLFIPLDEALSFEDNDKICTTLAANPPYFASVLPNTCFLTGRKFGFDTKFSVKRLFLDCNGDVNLMTREACIEENRCHSFFGRLKTVFVKDAC